MVPDNNGLQVKQLYFTVQSVDVEGNNVVNRSQTKFFPATDRVVQVPLLFFDATVRARDALFGFGLSGDLLMRYPNGQERTLRLGSDGKVELPGLARGQYDLTVSGPGLRVSQPVSMSRRQVVDLKVFTWLDVVVVSVLALVLAGGLLWWGRRLHRRRGRSAPGPEGAGRGRCSPRNRCPPRTSGAGAGAGHRASAVPRAVGPFLIHAGPLPPRSSAPPVRKAESESS